MGVPLHSGLEVRGWTEVPPNPSMSPITKKSPNLGRFGD